MPAKHILILGGGDAGTMVANKLRHSLPEEKWAITVIDRDNKHVYQTGQLFVPFDLDDPRKLVKPRNRFFKPGITFVQDIIANIDPDNKKVTTKAGKELTYDFLIISTGCNPDPTEDEGLAEAMGNDVYSFYSLDGAIQLRDALKKFEGGKLVIDIASLPIKCPVAPMEFAFLADWYFKQRGIRDRVEIELVTPAAGAFTKPKASSVLSKIAEEKNVTIRANWGLGMVNGKEKWIQNLQGSERINYDMMVTIPTNVGDKAISDSGIDDGMGYVHTDHHTLQAKGMERVYVLGDATNCPTSKAGAAAHYQVDTVLRNVLTEIAGGEAIPSYDGHAT